jgi:hypothetical protein
LFQELQFAHLKVAATTPTPRKMKLDISPFVRLF